MKRKPRPGPFSRIACELLGGAVDHVLAQVEGDPRAGALARAIRSELKPSVPVAQVELEKPRKRRKRRKRAKLQRAKVLRGAIIDARVRENPDGSVTVEVP